MIERYSTALTLVKACWKVLLLDKELLVFPLLTILALGALLAGAFGPLVASGEFQAMVENLSQEPAFNNELLMAAIGFAAYFVVYFVIVFFNSALIACVNIRVSGGDPTVMD